MWKKIEKPDFLKRQGKSIENFTIRKIGN